MTESNRARWRESVRLHALLWLALANLVGVLLAAELVWPQVGDWLEPFSYGRWSPLHLDWQLYGWCSLPLVGVLMAGFEPERAARPAVPLHDRLFRAALIAWSVALFLSGIGWLGGHNSGKLFLEWSGPAVLALPAAMSLLWFALAVSAWQGRGRSSVATWARFGALVLLAAVPASIAWAAGPSVYPAVNPDSGGATGTSLLGSTLGIVAVFGAAPLLLRVEQTSRTAFRLYWIFWAVEGVVFGLVNHHNASHHAVSQVLALGSLAGWIPLAWFAFRGFRWSDGARPWLLAAFAWWALLILTGWTTFLPGVSERLKFTNALVAHAHLAMAGLVTSFHVALLNQLLPASPLRRGFGAWQAACATYVLSMGILGWTEAEHADELFRSEPWTQALLGLRLAAGTVMAIVSVRWFMQAAGACSRRAALHDGQRLASALPRFEP